MPHNAVSHIQQQYAAHHPQCNTFTLDKPKSFAYGYTAVFIAFNNADGTPTNETLTLDSIHAAAEACEVIDMGFDYTPYYKGEPVNPPTCHLIMGTNFGESNKKYALSSLYGTARIYLITADAPTVKVDGFMTKLSMFANKVRNSETWNRAKAYILSSSPAHEELQSFACSFTTYAMPRKYIVDHEKPWRPEKEIVVNNSLQMAFRPGIFWPKQSAVDPSRPLTVRVSEGPATFDSLSEVTCGGVPVEKVAKALEKRQNINTYIYHFAYPKNLGEQPNLAVISYMVDVLALHLRELDKLQLAPNAQPPLEWTMEDMLFSSAFVAQDLVEQSGIPEGSHFQVPGGRPRQRVQQGRPAPAARPAQEARPAPASRPAPAPQQAPDQPTPNPRPDYANPPYHTANQAAATQTAPGYSQAPQYQPSPEYHSNPQGYQNQGYADAPYRAETQYRPDAQYHPGAYQAQGYQDPNYQAQGYQQHPQPNYPYQQVPPQYQQNPAYQQNPVYQQDVPTQQRPVFQPSPTGTRYAGKQKGFWGKVASFLKGE